MRAHWILILFCAGCSSGPNDPGGDGGANDLAMDLAPPSVPLRHRATAMACPAARPSENCGMPDLGLIGPPSSCNGDSTCTQGSNGRCVGDPHDGCSCSYDTCVTDGDCATGTLCDCRDQWLKGRTEGPNSCLPSDCRVDADCGMNGYCSPSLDPGCGLFAGVTLWHCHTPKDECTNDSDCAALDGGYVLPWCGYHPEVGHWACSIVECAG